MSTPITTDAECIDRLLATGHRFHLGIGGDINITHPLAQPDPREMDSITAYLSARWSEVMLAIRRHLTAEGPIL